MNEKELQVPVGRGDGADTYNFDEDDAERNEVNEQHNEIWVPNDIDEQHNDANDLRKVRWTDNRNKVMKGFFRNKRNQE